MEEPGPSSSGSALKESGKSKSFLKNDPISTLMADSDYSDDDDDDISIRLRSGIVKRYEVGRLLDLPTKVNWLPNRRKAFVVLFKLKMCVNAFLYSY